MTITTAELARIRTAAIGDMLGDSKELDGMGSATTIFRLCQELELARKHSVTMSEVAAAAWDGEIPSPLPGHVSSEEKMEEMFDRRSNSSTLFCNESSCFFCGQSNLQT